MLRGHRYDEFRYAAAGECLQNAKVCPMKIPRVERGLHLLRKVGKRYVFGHSIFNVLSGFCRSGITTRGLPPPLRGLSRSNFCVMSEMGAEPSGGSGQRLLSQFRRQFLDVKTASLQKTTNFLSKYVTILPDFR
jgi:hypothetical protein